MTWEQDRNPTMEEIYPLILNSYIKDIMIRIETKYGFEPMEALRKFLYSETYQMLENVDLAMWEFSPLGIIDMWEVEKITGDPRNSLYLRRDEFTSSN